MFLNSSTRQVSRSDLIVDYFAVGSGIGVLMKVTSTIPSVYDSLQQASLSQLSQALMTSVSNVRVFMDTYSPTRYPTHLPSYSPTQQNLRVCEITLGDLNYGDSSSFNATIAQRLVENLATFLNKPARPVSRSSLLVDFFAGSVLMRARLPYPQNYDEIQQASLDQLSQALMTRVSSIAIVLDTYSPTALPTTPPTPGGSSDKDDMDGGEVAGIVFGVIGALVAIIVALTCYYCKGCLWYTLRNKDDDMYLQMDRGDRNRSVVGKSMVID